jgi:hypothetical protein
LLTPLDAKQQSLGMLQCAAWAATKVLLLAMSQAHFDSSFLAKNITAKRIWLSVMSQAGDVENSIEQTNSMHSLSCPLVLKICI